jgi:NADPH:quinone reductase-like Zn-dependent oxidoreductase
VTAWQGIFDAGKLQPGQRVLVQGAAGGVGLFGAQLARWRGAHVAGTASTGNLDFVRSLGVDDAVDYTSGPVNEAMSGVDLVLDTVGGSTLEPSLLALRQGGTLVCVAGAPPQERAQELGVHVAGVRARVSSALLAEIARLLDEGVVTTHVYETFPLSDARAAHELSQSGHGRGRIVLRVGS